MASVPASIKKSITRLEEAAIETAQWVKAPATKPMTWIQSWDW